MLLVVLAHTSFNIGSSSFLDTPLFDHGFDVVVHRWIILLSHRVLVIGFEVRTAFDAPKQKFQQLSREPIQNAGWKRLQFGVNLKTKLDAGAIVTQWLNQEAALHVCPDNVCTPRVSKQSADEPVQADGCKNGRTISRLWNLAVWVLLHRAHENHYLLLLQYVHTL